MGQYGTRRLEGGHAPECFTLEPAHVTPSIEEICINKFLVKDKVKHAEIVLRLNAQ
jgi:hypothetical protein